MKMYNCTVILNFRPLNLYSFPAHPALLTKVNVVYNLQLPEWHLEGKRMLILAGGSKTPCLF